MSFHHIAPPNPINTYIINLVKRSDRRLNIIKEFRYKSEFRVTIVDAIEDISGVISLWNTLCSIIQHASDQNFEYILICEDDHQFTKAYSEKKIRKNIEKAKSIGCDLLLGGISWYEDIKLVDQSIFWTNSFNGLQFTIIFKKFFIKILNSNFNEFDAVDYHLGKLTSNVYIIHPFISIQRDYPYSDVTPSNNIPGRVKNLFSSTEDKLNQLRKLLK